MLKVGEHILIPEHCLCEKFIRASGPGGQNVNKVNSAVQLRFDLGACDELDDAVKARLRDMAGDRLTVDDEVLIEARTHRSQHRNRVAARRRLARLIEKALEEPKKRRRSKVSRRQKRKRVEAKRRRGETKRLRKSPKLPPRG